ncbi:antA/AntB antirepressor family protein [Ferrovum sp.]|uniref:antA/AntB antirepressor family protein n=1 Tax=Ferrovum sp. TaxID=2609467 RepID=UPI002623A149|nr:antA/AntB antirepressor family protein [Ferrovum sp.]
MNIVISEKAFGKELVQTVNARELHEFLKVRKDFSTWIKDRIKKYGFEESQDFVMQEVLSSPNLGSSKSRQQKMVEYYITLEMAKELAMVENSVRGKEARQYFIECEKKLRATPLPPRTDTFEVLGGVNIKKFEQAAKLHRTARLLARCRGLSMADQVKHADALILKTSGFDIPKILGLPASYVGHVKEERKTNGSQPYLPGFQVDDKTAALIADEVSRPKIITVLTSDGVRLEVSENELLNATTLAKYCGFSSGQTMNTWLVDRGFQKPVGRRAGKTDYEPVGNGLKYGVLMSVSRQGSHGSSVPQLCWKAELVDVVRNMIEIRSNSRPSAQEHVRH